MGNGWGGIVRVLYVRIYCMFNIIETLQNYFTRELLPDVAVQWHFLLRKLVAEPCLAVNCSEEVLSTASAAHVVCGQDTRSLTCTQHLRQQEFHCCWFAGVKQSTVSVATGHQLRTV